MGGGLQTATSAVPLPALLTDGSSVTATPTTASPMQVTGPQRPPARPAEGLPGAGQAQDGHRQHRGAGRCRQIPRGPGQGSSATGRGTADHPPHPPYLGVLRPTVMDTIETPKIDRLHRLGAVSLTVRAGGGQGDGTAHSRDRPPPAVLAGPVLSFPAGMPQGPCPVPGAQAPIACRERLQGLMHGGLVGYMVFTISCKLMSPGASVWSSSRCPGQGKPRGQPGPWGAPQEPQTSCLYHRGSAGDEPSQGSMLSIPIGVTGTPVGAVMPGVAPARAAQPAGPVAPARQPTCPGSCSLGGHDGHGLVPAASPPPTALAWLPTLLQHPWELCGPHPCSCTFPVPTLHPGGHLTVHWVSEQCLQILRPKADQHGEKRPSLGAGLRVTTEEPAEGWGNPGHHCGTGGIPGLCDQHPRTGA